MAGFIPFVFVAYAVTYVACQSISKLPLPSMEWIPVTTAGSGPPPLSGACLSGDGSADGKVVLVGGISASGTLTATTYILELDNLTWRSPSTAVSTFQPDPRANAICTYDRSSNFRSEILLYGGLQSLSPPTPTSTMFSFEMTYEFWSEIQVTSGSPIAVFDAAGGVDPTISSSSQDVNNPFIVLSGYSGEDKSHPQGAVLGGTLSSNVQSVTVNWGNFGADYSSGQNVWGAAGAIIGGSQTALVSGCDASAIGNMDYSSFSKSNAACASSNLTLLSFSSAFSAGATFSSLPQPSLSTQTTLCPAPRIGGKMVPNRATSSNSYGTQALLFGGLIDSETWDDGGGSNKGEIAVLDLTTETWSRVIPSGAQVPSARTNPSVFALAGAISNVGSSAARGTVDVLVFGGREVETGDALNDLWVLRLHGGNPVTDSVQGGMTYLSQCATKVVIPPSTTSSSAPTTSTSTTSTTTPAVTSHSDQWTVSSSHQYLSGLSIVIALPSILLLRYASSPPSTFLGFSTLAISYTLGVAGAAIGLSTAKVEDEDKTLIRRADTPASEPSILSTLHAQVGVAVFAVVYGALPLLYLLLFCRGVRNKEDMEKGQTVSQTEKVPIGIPLLEPTEEKTPMSPNSEFSLIPTPPSAHHFEGNRNVNVSRPLRRPSAHSSVFENSDSDTDEDADASPNPPSAWKFKKRPRLVKQRRDKAGSMSGATVAGEEGLNEVAEGEELNEFKPRSNSVSSFQVLNRKRQSTASQPGRSSTSDLGSRPETPAPLLTSHSRNQSYMSTFNSYLNGSSQYQSVNMQANASDTARSTNSPRMPPHVHEYRRITKRQCIAAIALHVALIFSAIYLLATLFSTSKGLFGAFLAWVLIFYVLFILLAAKGHPQNSSVAILLERRKTQATPPNVPSELPSKNVPPQNIRRGSSDDTAELEEEDDDDAAERRLSEREVQVMTIPKRKLSVINA
ncbi:hypothetical protein BT69DRAFT_1276546 [Atractiella rhizophila]|nr:hypothetical protein BT69DRAFT_1276546 [Atractiella rhizophila]